MSLKPNKRRQFINLFSIIFGCTSIAFLFFNFSILTVSSSCCNTPSKTKQEDKDTLTNLFRYTHAQLMGLQPTDTSYFGTIRKVISSTLSEANQDSIDASIYFRPVNGEHIVAFHSEKTFDYYSNGVLPVMMATLRADDADSTILQKKVVYRGIDIEDNSGKMALKNGTSTTLNNLLNVMVQTQSKDAAEAIANEVGIEKCKDALKSIEGENADNLFGATSINAGDFSKYLWVLYNNLYLTKKNSELACRLISASNKTTTTDFKGTQTLQWLQQSKNLMTHQETVVLTEIVYVEGVQYMCTVVAQGNNGEKLHHGLEKIESKIFETLSGSGKHS